VTTFDELYPDAANGFEAPDQDVFKTGQAKACEVCQAPTHWVDLSFEARFCSPLCLQDMWQQYLEALKR
jgi:hypothetical protein